MRVNLRIGAAFPELIEDLESFSAKDRAERVRFLAAVGLQSLKGRLEPSVAAGVAQRPAEPPVEAAPAAKPVATTAEKPKKPEPKKDPVKEAKKRGHVSRIVGGF